MKGPLIIHCLRPNLSETGRLLWCFMKFVYPVQEWKRLYLCVQMTPKDVRWERLYVDVANTTGFFSFTSLFKKIVEVFIFCDAHEFHVMLDNRSMA